MGHFVGGWKAFSLLSWNVVRDVAAKLWVHSGRNPLVTYTFRTLQKINIKSFTCHDRMQMRCEAEEGDECGNQAEVMRRDLS